MKKIEYITVRVGGNSTSSATSVGIFVELDSGVEGSCVDDGQRLQYRKTSAMVSENAPECTD